MGIGSASNLTLDESTDREFINGEYYFNKGSVAINDGASTAFPLMTGTQQVIADKVLHWVPISIEMITVPFNHQCSPYTNLLNVKCITPLICRTMLGFEMRCIK